MQKWEYKIIKFVNVDESVLRELGEEGWELAGVTENPSYYTFSFKRPQN